MDGAIVRSLLGIALSVLGSAVVVMSVLCTYMGALELLCLCEGFSYLAGQLTLFEKAKQVISGSCLPTDEPSEEGEWWEACSIFLFEL